MKEGETKVGEREKDALITSLQLYYMLSSNIPVFQRHTYHVPE